ncbi:hypothetical protein E0H26_12720 [Micromonospora zingiberis]|uniref:Uncharacterized protein n=1 Tax=Micromonospora zingiberis TaxID=2053011 RepID=A0A4R0GNV2_9ACTN|nr:hypothetical protein [Micromonospora zingiberis]TCB97148.1 hypothetical protein E0H26_12720 [Micromonospora zingiberis]
MNETDRLRAAIRATEPEGWGQFDVEAIMREGRRLRYRRRAVAGAGVMLSVAVAAVGVLVVLRQPGPVEPGVPPVVTATATTPGAGSTVDPTGPPEKPALGEVLGTGIWYGGDERVFYFVPVEVPRAAGVTIGLVAGRRSPDGRLTADFLLNDFEGSDRRPGFHQIGYEPSAVVVPADPVPTFGYFVGPAARIVGSVGKRPVAAQLSRWSEDSDVVIFWFHPKSLPPGQRLDGILAWDAQDRQL